MALWFTPPTVDEVQILDGLLRVTMRRGISVLNEAGAYRQVRNPSQYECEAADAVYLGGHKHPITEAEQTALTAAGYGAYIEDDGGF